MNEYRLTHSVFECVTVTEIHWSLWWRWHHLVAVWYLPQLCPGIVHLQVRYLTVSVDSPELRADARPLSQLAVNFTAGLAFSRLIHGLRSWFIGASLLSFHIRTDSFTAWQHASSMLTFFCRLHAVQNRHILMHCVGPTL